MLLVTAIVVGGTLLVSDPLVDERARRDALDDLAEVTAAAHTALEGGAEPRELADDIAASEAAQVAIYGPDDALLARSEASRRRVGGTELARIRRLGRASEVRPDAEGRPWIYLWVAGDDGPVVRAARPLARTSAARSTMREVLLLAGLFALLMSVVLSEYLTRTIGEPIRDMTRATDALRGGDLGARVRSRRRDALGALGGAIDRLGDQLAARLDAAGRE